MTKKRNPKDQGRQFDVVLWGATGFTGELVAEHLVSTINDSGIRLAFGGRSESKLLAVRSRLKSQSDAAAEIPLLVGDSFDEARLREIAAQTRVIISTVGPYAKYGNALVAACVAEGTHYCDLAGETQWIGRMIDEHHENAQKSGAKIVHCCGFDSIPSDIGVWMLHRFMQEKHGGKLNSVELAVRSMKGEFSGGTMASMMNQAEEIQQNPDLLKSLQNPYSLNPEGERSGPDGPDQFGLRRAPSGKGWTGPFVMSAINTRVVRRTNALLDYPYGRDFRYSEFSQFPAGPRGFALAASTSGFLMALFGLTAVGPTRELLKRYVLPKPGEGPNAKKREAGYFKFRLTGEGQDGDGRTIRIRGDVEGERDPGYGETARILGETALCLALDDLDSHPELLKSGVLTPASAMGDVLLSRFRDFGMRYDVSEAN